MTTILLNHKLLFNCPLKSYFTHHQACINITEGLTMNPSHDSRAVIIDYK